MRVLRVGAGAGCIGLSFVGISKYVDFLNKYDGAKRRNYLKDIKTAVVANGGLEK